MTDIIFNNFKITSFLLRTFMCVWGKRDVFNKYVYIRYKY